MVRSQLLSLTLVCLLTSFCSVSFAATAETTLLDFTSDHCGPCRQMEPVLRQLAAQGWQVRSVDVGREPKMAAQYKVDATPTFIVLVDGREWARLVGGTTLDQMLEMLHHANALAAQYAESHGERSDNSIDLKHGSDEGRVVPISPAPDPFSVRPAGGATSVGPNGGGTPARGASAPAPPDGGGAAPPAQGADADHLVAATVRLSVSDPSGRSTGTGAIVDARNGKALVLTCGHLFRESKGTGAIEISLFKPGTNGAELRGKVAGELIAYDLDRDLAFVRFQTASPVEVAPIAPAGTALAQGAAATSVGCNHGDNPTAWSTRITSLNKYQGNPNVEAAHAPVEGRSGGGLFNAKGQLIGVCFAADPAGDEGLYSSLDSIHAKLDELGMSTVYQSPATGGATVAGPASSSQAGGDQLAAAGDANMAVRGQEPTPTPSRTFPGDWPASAGGASRGGQPLAGASAQTRADFDAASLAGLTAEERTTLEEIARRSGGAEVICIVRPQTPDGRSDVIKLSNVSPAFVKALMASAGQTSTGGATGGAAPMATAAAPGATRR